MRTAFKILFFLIIAFFTSTVLKAQTTSWLKQTWGGQSGSYYVDKAGNSYSGGAYHQLWKTVGGVTLPSNGELNVFAAKYNTKGNLVWAATSTSSAGALAQAQGICANEQGELFIAGYFARSLIFDNITLNSNNGSADIFLTKYDANGKAIWAQAIGGASANYAYQVLLDDASNCYLSGTFEYPLVIGDTVIYGPNKGGSKSFIAKFSTNGHLLWLRTLHGMVFCPKIKVTPSGELFAFGQFQDALTWEGDTIFTKGGIDFSIIKLAPNGQSKWMTILSGNDFNYVHDLCFDKLGNPYLLGSTEGETFLNDSLLYTFSKYTYFVSKLNNLGKLSWLKPTQQYRDTTEFYMTKIMTNSENQPVVYGRLTDLWDSIARVYHYDYGLYRETFDAEKGGLVNTYIYPDVPNAVWLFEDKWNNLYLSSSFNYQVQVGNKSLRCDYMYAQYLAKIGNKGELVMSTLNLYPNPTKGKVQIAFEQWSATAISYELFQSNGIKVGEGLVSEQDNSIDLTHLNNGFYFLRLHDANAATKVVKVIKY
jgi:hypothetical protein